jgi:hypothetical protein
MNDSRATIQNNTLKAGIMKYFHSFFCIVVICFLMLQPSHAQVRFGIQGGLSVPNLSGGNNEVSQGYTSRLAPNAGVNAEFGIARQFSIQPEIDFDGQGGQRNGLQPITTVDLPPLPSGGYYYANFKNMSILNYLEVPVFVKYSLGGIFVKFHVMAGPYAGLLLSATQKTSGTSTIYTDKNGSALVMPDGSGGYVQAPPQSFDASTGVKSSIHEVNAGIAGGIGASLPLMPGSSLDISIRGLYGVTNIQTSAADGMSHTGNLIVTIGYEWELLVI